MILRAFQQLRCLSGGTIMVLSHGNGDCVLLQKCFVVVSSEPETHAADRRSGS
jgi:hypothetical protein